MTPWWSTLAARPQTRCTSTAIADPGDPVGVGINCPGTRSCRSQPPEGGNLVPYKVQVTRRRLHPYDRGAPVASVGLQR